jgi:hypothetical protein
LELIRAEDLQFVFFMRGHGKSFEIIILVSNYNQVYLCNA